MAAGNRSLLVVLDSRRQAERARADRTVFAALDHFGVAYEVLECGEYMGSAPDHLAPRAAYVLAHDGAGAGLKAEVAARIAQEVGLGAGLLTLDREIEAWPAPLRGLLPADAIHEEAGSLRFSGPPSFITFGHEQDEELALREPIEVVGFPRDESWQLLLATEAGRGVLLRGRAGEGRVAVFGTGERLYAEEVFGHVHGVDGLLWRSLLWVARKPFPARCIPPYVTARMDDCNGSYDAFGYVGVLNRHGISPNLGLFVDELGPTDWAAVERLFRAGGADFSMHAFRDDFYLARPNYKPFAVLADKPDLSRGGTQPLFEGLSLDHVTGRDLDDATVRRNFQRMDTAFARAGIRHSCVLNAHYGEIGWRAVPLFLERGVDMPTNNAVAGQLYGHQPSWRPRPYGVRGASGRYGLVIDRCPAHPGFTFVAMSVSHLGSTHMVSDVLSGHVPFLGEADRPLIPEAVRRGAANVKIGLDALAFGTIMTHEERIAVISPGDWEAVVTGIVRALEGWDVEFTGRERVSIISKRLLDSRLVYAEATDGRLRCELCGRTDGPSPLTVWEDEGDECVRRVSEVDAFDGFCEVTV